MSTKECRVCKHNCDEDELTGSLHNEELRKNLERFTGIKYSTISANPKVCTQCFNTVKYFAAITISWKKKEEQSLKNQPKMKFPMIKLEPEVVDKYCKNVAKVASSDNENSFIATQKVFKTKIENKNLLDLNEFKHVKIDKQFVEPNGKIMEKWIQENAANTTFWNHLNFFCVGCKSDISSLSVYLDHYKNENFTSFRLNCDTCKGAGEHRKMFTCLSAMLNHITSHPNLDYLKFVCIVCNVTFYNVPTLVQHYVDAHPDFSNFYMCLECGYYCSTLPYLRIHKTKHEEAIQKIADEYGSSTESGDNDSSEDYLPNKRIRRTSSGGKLLRSYSEKMERTVAISSMCQKIEEPRPLVRVKSSSNIANENRYYHPKTNKFDENSDRITYPCQVEGCNKILTTASGYEYHQLVHAGIFPYHCTYINCTAKFRSNQSLNNHIRQIHQNRRT